MTIYGFTVVYLLMLAASVFNLYTFLYKKGKYRNMPITLFYVLATLNLLVRLGYFTFFYPAVSSNNMIALLMPPLLKINIGLLQSWIMIEIALSFHLHIQLFKRISSLDYLMLSKSTEN